METSEISEHQLRVFLFVKGSSGWVTSAQIAQGAKVAPRTARGHAFKLVALEIFDMAEVFPGQRYTFSPIAEKRNLAYLLRLNKAIEITNLS